MQTRDSLQDRLSNQPTEKIPVGVQTRVEQLLARTPGLWRNRQAEQKQQEQPVSNLYIHPTARKLPAADLFNDAEAGKASAGVSVQSSGFAELDRLLPYGGWPTSGLVEIVSKHKAIGELQLLMPMLRQRSQQQQSLLWITPPYTLHGPALAQSGVNIRNSFVIPSQTRCNNALWSIEKALQSSECGMVLAWQNWLSARVIRRLQLAASDGQTLGVLFHQRPTPHSPATLQLEINPAPPAPDGSRQIDIRLLKARGSYRQGQIRLCLPA